VEQKQQEPYIPVNLNVMVVPLAAVIWLGMNWKTPPPGVLVSAPTMAVTV
jgi:hypothetical protein